MKHFTNALKSINGGMLKEKMAVLMNTWLTHRQMGEAETIYKLFISENLVHLAYLFKHVLRRNAADI